MSELFICVNKWPAALRHRTILPKPITINQQALPVCQQSNGIDFIYANKNVKYFLTFLLHVIVQSFTFVSMITLNEKAIELIRKDRQLKTKLMAALGCSERILYRDLSMNNSKLTEIDALNTLVEHTEIPLSELITGGKISKLLAR